MRAGGEIVSTFGSPEKVKLGHCKLIEEIMIGEDKVGVAYGNKYYIIPFVYLVCVAHFQIQLE